MSFSRALPLRFRTLVASAAILGAAGVVPVWTPASATPTYTRNEPAVAAASPALVYLEMTYTGYVRDLATGIPRYSEPLVVRRRCSGVVVNPDGDVLTTTVCVQPSDEIILVNALYTLGRGLVTENRLTPDRLDAYVAGIKDTSAFSGLRPGSKPAVTLFGQFDDVTPAIITPPAIPGTVLATQPSDKGNAALVKLQLSNLPVVELTTSIDNPKPGTAVVILGYGRVPDDNIGHIVRSRTVNVTGRTGTNRLGVSADIGPDSRGGAVVDPRGRLIALLDTDSAAVGDPNHDLITMLHLTRLLAQAGVTNQLTDVDRAYRHALDAYFAGRFSQAVSEFDRVLEQAPQRTAARTYRDRARERLETEGDAVENAGTWFDYVSSVASGVLIIVLLSVGARFLSRFRTQRNPPTGRVEHAAPAPTSGAPHPAPAPPAVAPPEPSWGDTVILPALPLDGTITIPAVPDDESVLLPEVMLDDGPGRPAGG